MLKIENSKIISLGKKVDLIEKMSIISSGREEKQRQRWFEGCVASSEGGM